MMGDGWTAAVAGHVSELERREIRHTRTMVVLVLCLLRAPLTILLNIFIVDA